MKIETDQVRIVSGVRHSRTIGSPIAILIENKDWKNWTGILPVQESDAVAGSEKPVKRPRPGHADLAGAIKYDFPEARYVLEVADPHLVILPMDVTGSAHSYRILFRESSRIRLALDGLYTPHEQNRAM